MMCGSGLLGELAPERPCGVLDVVDVDVVVGGVLEDLLGQRARYRCAAARGPVRGRLEMDDYVTGLTGRRLVDVGTRGWGDVRDTQLVADEPFARVDRDGGEAGAVGAAGAGHFPGPAAAAGAGGGGR